MPIKTARKTAKKAATSPARRAAKPGKKAAKSPARATARPAKHSAKSHEVAIGPAASKLIDGRIRELGDWRGKTLAYVRRLIHEADPEVVEEWKWMGTPVWSHDGILCTGETYQSVVKLTFAKGASVHDPARLFNSSLEGNVRRALDLREGDTLDEPAFKTLIRTAVALNLEAAAQKRGRR